MLIFLYGLDTYRSRQKLNEIIEHYKKVHKSGLNFKIFDGENLNYQDFKDEFRQTSMFNEKKMFIIKNIFSNSEFQESFLEDAKNFINLANITIFYEEGEPSQSVFFKFLTKNAKAQEFKLLEGQKLKNWAKKEFEKCQTRIDPQALDVLIGFVGNDLWQLSNEIKKLVTFKKSPPFARGKEIATKDVVLLVRPKIEADIFKTIDAIALRNKKRAISLVHKHLEKGDSPLYLLSMINFQLRNLLMVKTSNNLKLHPYVMKKTSFQARGFTIEELKKIYHKLFQVDLDIKTGKIEPGMALDLFLTEI